jgi:hypothetical protein
VVRNLIGAPIFLGVGFISKKYIKAIKTMRLDDIKK